MTNATTTFAASGNRQVRLGALLLVSVVPGLVAAAALARGDPARAPLWVALGGVLGLLLVLGMGEALRPVVLLDGAQVRVRSRWRWRTFDRARIARVEERRSAPGEARAHLAVLLQEGGAPLGSIDLDEVGSPAELLRALRTPPVPQATQD